MTTARSYRPPHDASSTILDRSSGDVSPKDANPKIMLATRDAQAKIADTEAARQQATTETKIEFPAPRPSDPLLPRPDARPADAKGVGTKPASRKRLLLASVGVAALIAAGWYGYRYMTVDRYFVSTDDAYVGADMAIIAPKIAANVAEVPVSNNQRVKAGDVLVRLDDGDYRLAVEQAAAKLATQQAALAVFDSQIAASQAAADQARAQLNANTAALTKAEADFERTNALAQRDVSTKASLDAARANRDSAKAQLSAQHAAIALADANVGVLRAQKTQSEQTIKELEVALAKAKYDLSFTVVRAPLDGVIGNKSVQVGDYVTPGKRLAAVVPLDKIYVDANFKETQLARIEAGEPVSVRVDALGGAVVNGTVESVAPASGSRFSLLPPDNATGNFTKIVQRVPVRIAIAAKDAQGKLRPGLSVVVDIDTRQ